MSEAADREAARRMGLAVVAALCRRDRKAARLLLAHAAPWQQKHLAAFLAETIARMVDQFAEGPGAAEGERVAGLVSDALVEMAAKDGL